MNHNSVILMEICKAGSLFDRVGSFFFCVKQEISTINYDVQNNHLL